MNCKNLKIRTKKGKKFGYCTLYQKEVPIFSCNCNNKEYKHYKTLKPRTNKQAKKEKERFSILTNDLEHCILCGQKKDNLHEVFGGRNRANSMQYGIVIPLCLFHHQEIHKNKELQDFYHKLGQKKFMEYYHKLKEDFVKIFKKNYL